MTDNQTTGQSPYHAEAVQLADTLIMLFADFRMAEIVSTLERALWDAHLKGPSDRL